MRPDGGESRKITDAKDGVAQFQFTRDGKWLVYSAGKAEDRQLWMLPVSGIESAPAGPAHEARHAARHVGPVERRQDRVLPCAGLGGQG